MKKGTLLNSEVSYLVSTLGHTDEVTVADAGLPIPEEVTRIDLALKRGIPSFLDTVAVLLESAQVEGVILAEEFAKVSPDTHAQLMGLLELERERSGKDIRVSYLSHEDFKLRSFESRAVIRTGECTPYANMIFQSGVVF